MYFDSFKAVMMRLAFNPSYNDSFGGPDQTGLEERIGLDCLSMFSEQSVRLSSNRGRGFSRCISFRLPKGFVLVEGF